MMDVLLTLAGLLDARKDQGGTITKENENDAILVLAELIRKEVREELYVDGEAVDLLRRLAKANVIFPSMCANNMEAWNLAEELKKYLPSSPAISAREEGK